MNTDEEHKRGTLIPGDNHACDMTVWKRDVRIAAPTPQGPLPR